MACYACQNTELIMVKTDSIVERKVQIGELKHGIQRSQLKVLWGIWINIIQGSQINKQVKNLRINRC